MKVSFQLLRRDWYSGAGVKGGAQSKKRAIVFFQVRVWSGLELGDCGGDAAPFFKSKK